MKAPTGSTTRQRGRVRVEDGKKRLRVYFGGAVVADTTRPLLVWEKPAYPAYYLPEADVRMELLSPDGGVVHSPSRGDAETFTVRAGGREAAGAALRYGHSPFEELRDAIRLEWNAMDAWFEEDEQVFTHPRDPYTRVDILPSSRHIRIETGGETIAETTKPTLLFEFHGTSQAGVSEHATSVQEIAAEHGGSGFRWATTTEDRATLWAARHNTYYAALAMRPGGKAWVTDVCVPISALAECIVETKRDLAASRAYAPLVGHVGDGNFHLNFVLDPADPAQVAEVKALNARLVQRALRLGGTCTGEHGIGLGKQQYLLDEHGEDAVAVMRALKAALDPQGLMNPGKIFS